jgi:hypothetical protein
MFLLSLFSISLAQEQKKSPKKEEWRVGLFLTSGFMPIDIDDLNSKLESKGYSTYSDNMRTYGAVLQFIVDKFVIETEFNEMVEKEITSGTRSPQFAYSANYLLVNFGYVVNEKYNLIVYPLIGVGIGGMNLMISENSSDRTFEDILIDPRRMGRTWEDRYILKISLGTDYQLNIGSFGKDGETKIHLNIGLRVGQVFANLIEENSPWIIEGVELSDGPLTDITGPHIILMIGGGINFKF